MDCSTPRFPVPHRSETFPLKLRTKCGFSLSPFLFNIALEVRVKEFKLEKRNERHPI